MLFSRFLIGTLLIIYIACNQDPTSKNNSNIAISKPIKKSVKQAVKSIPTKISEIQLPEGYLRLEADSQSFAFYLQNLPLKTNDNTIYSYDGSVISTGGYHHSIIDIDIGKQDLLQNLPNKLTIKTKFVD